MGLATCVADLLSGGAGALMLCCAAVLGLDSGVWQRVIPFPTGWGMTLAAPFCSQLAVAGALIACVYCFPASMCSAAFPEGVCSIGF
jgi:hypothetical protein